MLNLTALELAGILLGIAVCEWIVYWATLAVTDAPEQSLVKTTFGAFGVSAVTVPLLYVFYLYLVTPEESSLGSPALRWVLFFVLSFTVAFVLPVLVYLPLLPSGVNKSTQVSIVRVLLSIFLYSLLAGVVFVVLAVLQIYRERTVLEPSRKVEFASLSSMGTPAERASVVV